MDKVASVFQRWLLRGVRRLAGSAPVRFAVGDCVEAAPPAAVATIRFRDVRTLTKVLLNPEIEFGDGYSTGQIEVEGDLVRVLEVLYPAAQRKTWYSRWRASWLLWTQANTLSGSRWNIQHHYDIPTDFYKLWLDPQLVYTCAYFPSDNATLAEAQEAKLNLVCRKLRLEPGENVVETGCGWGALALHMARNYGVKVKAFNISREQIAFARARAKAEGLSKRVEFIDDDYRNIPAGFDVFVSVGMLEHVGRQHYPELGRVIQRAIGNTGRGLLHFIGRNEPRPFSAWTRARIFPGGYPPGIAESLEVLETGHFGVRHIENLRPHYERTLRHWLDGFERSYDEVVRRFGVRFARMWRLYLAGSMLGFRVGTLQLFQVVFAGSECKRLPWTSVYMPEAAPEQRPEEREWIRAIS